MATNDAADSTYGDQTGSDNAQPDPSNALSRTVLDGHDIDRAVTRITHEILERNRDSRDIVLLGIPTRGVPLASRIGQRMGRVESCFVPSGALDVTMYRDDLQMQPARALEPTEIPADIDEKIVVLVDDVFYSGRTIRAGLDALGDIGRPRAVQLAVLVDRGHRELPIRADFVGKNLPTSHAETVQLSLTEVDGVDEVIISSAQSAAR